jgi:hypothetical protein
LKVKRKDVERLFILQSPCTSGQEKQILGTPISDAEILAAVEKANQKRGATLEDSVPELYKLAMPFYHSYIEKYRKEPTKKTIAKFLFDKHNTQNWNHTSIERLMNAHEIKLQYQEYKKTK